MTTSPIRLSVGLPAYGLHLDVGHAAMWMGLGIALASTAAKFTLTGFTEYHINGVDLARNTILYDALKTDADWLLMVDADTFHSAKGEASGDAGIDVLQMIMDGERHGNCGLIGAPVRGRAVGNVDAVMVQIDHDGPGFVPVANSPGHFRTPLGWLQGQEKPIPVSRIGGAFVAVNCNWMREKWNTAPWFVFEHEYGKGRPVNGRGEDYFVCDGIRARGGTVLCDPRFVPAHVARRKLIGEAD
jgi:hypothetical protein